MKNELLVEYLSDLVESCGYSLPTVEIEEHAKEIIEIVDRKNVPKMNDRDEQLKKLLRGSNHNIYGLIEAINQLLPDRGVCVDCKYYAYMYARCENKEINGYIEDPYKQSCTEFKQEGDENAI